MAKLIRSLAVLVLLCASACSTVTLHGEITDAQGAALEGVVVRLGNSEGVSDPQGQYEVAEGAPERSKPFALPVRLTKTGLEPFETEVGFPKGGARMRVDFVVSPEGELGPKAVEATPTQGN